MMCNYIKFCADRLLLCLGCNHHFKIENPFEWMETIRTPNLVSVLTALTNPLLLLLAFDTLPLCTSSLTTPPACYMLHITLFHLEHAHTLPHLLTPEALQRETTTQSVMNVTKVQ
jgi:hypothetical protein